jgi:hypothetical protein
VDFEDAETPSVSRRTQGSEDFSNTTRDTLERLDSDV